MKVKNKKLTNRFRFLLKEQGIFEVIQKCLFLFVKNRKRKSEFYGKRSR